jgi:hypothetical protein
MQDADSKTRRPPCDVRLLNQKRWESHVAAQQEADVAAAPVSPWGLKMINGAGAVPAVPTAGALFNRPNPIAHDDENNGREYVTHPYNRTIDKFLKRRGEKRAIGPDGNYYDYDERDQAQRAQMDEKKWNREAYVADRNGNIVKLMPVYGSDAFATNEASVHKRRIPNTSVVNKIGDLRVPFCCWGIRLTAAQWIWWTNLVCFLAHSFMAGLTLHMGYGRWGLNPFSDEGEHVKVRIFRISQVPTVTMYMNNLSRWSPGYNGSLSSEGRDIGGNEHWLHDNSLPVDFCWLTASFFLISAIFHLWALFVGIFERTWFLYWRQLDDCFAYWRWMEVWCTPTIVKSNTCSRAITSCPVLDFCQRHGDGHCHLHWPARTVDFGVNFHVFDHHFQPPA